MRRNRIPFPALTILLTAGMAACASGPESGTVPVAPVEAGPTGVSAAAPPDAWRVTERPATPLSERRAPSARNVVYDPSLFSDLEYHWIGPARGGRVTAVTGVRGRQGTYYMGSTGGGVFKTTDYGESWLNVSDGYFETGSIGAIRAAPSNGDVVWVSTGSDGFRSNVITGLGVYRSTDAGETWRFLGLRDIGNTGAIEVHPRNPDVAYVAAIGHPFGPNPERGVFRTRDGGETWDHVLFISDSTGINDVEIDPSNPDVIYAASWRGERRPWTIISGSYEGGIYKSTDGGDNWRKLAGGLPTGGDVLFGKMDLALSPTDPNVVYALIEATEPHDGLYRSSDGGATWEHVSSENNLLGRPFYYTNVDVDPTNPDIVWVNNLALWKSTNAGSSWQRVGTPHGDNHDIWIDPDNTDLMVQGNDGGANVTRDGGRTWSTQYNQPTAEMYSVATSDQYPYWVWGGQQDWDIIGVPSRPGALNDQINYGGGTCETGPAVPKPGEPEVNYNSCKGRFMLWDAVTGNLRHYYVGGVYMYGHAAGDLPYRFQRVAPVEVSPHDPSTVYHGSQFLHRTRDGGVTWETISPDLTAQPPGTQGISGEPITRDITGEEVYSTLYAIEESPVTEGVIWVGSYDGPFHVTRDGGETWDNVTPPDLEPGGRVQGIHASHHDAGTAYYSVLRFMLDDWHPYVYRTRDYGRTWALLTPGDNGIPADYPVRITREDPETPGLLYAGSEFGMFVSFDDGAHWQPLQLDLPVTPITDMEFKDDDLVLSTMGRGFWILRDLTPLRGLTRQVASARAHLYPVSDAILHEWFGGFGRPGPMDPEYGQPGAVVDWVMAREPAGAVTVELLDAAGNVVNGWSSEEGGYEYVTRQEMRGEETYRLGGPRVPKQAGHTRFVVPLNHVGGWSPPSRGRPAGLSGSGPTVAPGEYSVRVSADGWSARSAFNARMDPRVSEIGVTAADLEEQEQLVLRIQALASRANRAVHWIETELERAGASVRPGTAGREDSAAAAAAGQRVQRLRRLHAMLEEPDDVTYPQPMLRSQISYLAGMVGRSPQKPGRDAFERYEQLEAELARIEAEIEEMGG